MAVSDTIHCWTICVCATQIVTTVRQLSASQAVCAHLCRTMPLFRHRHTLKCEAADIARGHLVKPDFCVICPCNPISTAYLLGYGRSTGSDILIRYDRENERMVDSSQVGDRRYDRRVDRCNDHRRRWVLAHGTKTAFRRGPSGGSLH
jgi:hypothetical protein